MSGGMAGHESTRYDSEDWVTPMELVAPLGQFDLDPCEATPQPWKFAKKGYKKADDGFKQDWKGRVWLNPPYGRNTAHWLKRLADHGEGTALIFARTETKTFFSEVWDKAHAVLFLKGRVKFCLPDGSKPGNCAGAPSVMIAYGVKDAYKLEMSGIPGKFVRLR